MRACLPKRGEDGSASENQKYQGLNSDPCQKGRHETLPGTGARKQPLYTTLIDIAHLLWDGPRNAKKRAIAACLPDDGLARCA
jgi:hypothetical protein